MGVILHATNDYEPRSRAPVEAEVVVAMTPLKPISPDKLYVAPLEVSEPTIADEALRAQATPLILSALLLIVIAVFVRVAVSQSDRRTIGPAVAVIVAALVLLAAYLMRHDETPTTPAVNQTTEADQ